MHNEDVKIHKPIDIQPSKGRNIEIDLIKGFLVLVMFFYHSAAGGRIAEVAFLRYKLEFLHYAFLAISGFLCGRQYFPKLETSSARKVKQRLMKRGLKLLIIVVTASTAIFFLRIILHHEANLLQIDLSADRIIKFLSRGNDLTFHILYYIAVFLLTLSLVINSSFRTLFFFGFILLGVIKPTNLFRHVAYGYIGILGWILYCNHRDKFQRISKKLSRFKFPLLVLLMAEFIFVAPLSGTILHRMAAIVLEMALWFVAFVYLGKMLHSAAKLDKWILILGRYTLFAYTFHVLVVVVGYPTMVKLGLDGWICYSALLCVVTISTFTSVWTLDYARCYGLVNKLYLFIFGS